jgi:uncharacterized protein
MAVSMFSWLQPLLIPVQKIGLWQRCLAQSITLFEYMLQVPANRIGHTQFSVAQLKIMQEVITLTIFVRFALFYLDEQLKWDCLRAALCMVGAV